MLTQPYSLEELQFAWFYRVYYRWRTHRLSTFPALTQLNRETLHSLLEPYSIRILQTSATETDVTTLVSLLPSETVAAAASKMKGRVSKWLQGRIEGHHAKKLLSGGYFACTTGETTTEAVSHYLENQGEHHGYMSRLCPPVFVQHCPLQPADEQRLNAKHSVTSLRFHAVLSTWGRKGIFNQSAARATTERWLAAQATQPIAIEKLSFVPDHVHLALQVHPGVSPATTAVALMNTSQDLMSSNFADSMIRVDIRGLWTPSAYIGSFGDLESVKIGAYVRKWEQRAAN